MGPADGYGAMKGKGGVWVDTAWHWLEVLATIRPPPHSLNSPFSRHISVLSTLTSAICHATVKSLHSLIAACNVAAACAPCFGGLGVLCCTPS